MKLIIALFAIFLVCAQAAVKPAVSLDSLLETARKGATRALVDKASRFRGPTPDLVVTNIKKMEHNGAFYTFEVTMANDSNDEVCDFELRVLEGYQISLYEMRVTSIRCEILETGLRVGDGFLRWTKV